MFKAVLAPDGYFRKSLFHVSIFLRALLRLHHPRQLQSSRYVPICLGTKYEVDTPYLVREFGSAQLTPYIVATNIKLGVVPSFRYQTRM